VTVILDKKNPRSNKHEGLSLERSMTIDNLKKEFDTNSILKEKYGNLSKFSEV
jgi:hypothetical protein